MKSGVFEDRANGYAIGDYKQRPNMIGMYQTVRPESIHPFQDGNGRTGRLILFRECLKNRMIQVVIEDANRNEYLESLKEYREEKSLNKLTSLFEKRTTVLFGEMQIKSQPMFSLMFIGFMSK